MPTGRKDPGVGDKRKARREQLAAAQNAAASAGADAAASSSSSAMPANAWQALQDELSRLTVPPPRREAIEQAEREAARMDRRAAFRASQVDEQDVQRQKAVSEATPTCGTVVTSSCCLRYSSLLTGGKAATGCCSR